MTRFSVEARADRLQRRGTGPWRTVSHELGPVVLTQRYRRRRHIDFVRLDVAMHDVQRELLRGLGPVLRRLARLLGA